MTIREEKQHKLQMDGHSENKSKSSTQAKESMKDTSMIPASGYNLNIELSQGTTLIESRSNETAYTNGNTNLCCKLLQKKLISESFNIILENPKLFEMFFFTPHN